MRYITLNVDMLVVKSSTAVCLLASLQENLQVIHFNRSYFILNISLF